jgi:hypothetical protein
LWWEISSTTSGERPRRDLKKYFSGSLKPYLYSPPISATT